jgi:hypothetical protein
MKELEDIVAAFEKVKTGGKTAAIATSSKPLALLTDALVLEC